MDNCSCLKPHVLKHIRKGRVQRRVGVDRKGDFCVRVRLAFITRMVIGLSSPNEPNCGGGTATSMVDEARIDEFVMHGCKPAGIDTTFE